MSDTTRKPHSFHKVIRRVGAGAKNALDILRRGRLGAPYRASFEVLDEGPVHKLRRYEAPEPLADAPPVLLVPPLMVTSEIYDISPELSSISILGSSGLDVWLVDFGNPRADKKGMKRSLDEHILAVDRSIEKVAAQTGRKVHLIGYSQGGMFCYQAAGYRRAADVASVITFGSPVDIRRNLPVRVHDDIAERLIRAASQGISGPLDQIDGLPGWLTSNGFKLLNPQKELGQILSFFGLLHDREALQKREPKRRFLGGDGFVAWPGAALRDFVDQVIADNRMASGGFVVDGRTFSLADIDAPILYFLGSRDDLARPASVRAIERAAPDTETHGVEVPAGHFGLVVGSTAIGTVWPTVADWVHWKSDGRDEPPAALLDQPAPSVEPAEDAAPLAVADSDDSRTRQLYDLATHMVDGLWHKLGDVSRDIGNIVDTVRWQIPRLAQLESLGEDDKPINIGLALEQQARAIPDQTFFLWEGRAYTYAEADRRVNQLLSALVEQGAEPGMHVGVLMENHPDLLTTCAAVSRLGGVSVLLNSGLRGLSLTQALETGELDWLICGPEHIDFAEGSFDGPVGVLGASSQQRPLPEAVADLEALLDPQVDAPPEAIAPNPGLPEDTAMLIFTSGTTGLPKAAKITNRRWAMAALGTAAACTLSPRDTVYCALPLYHATGLLVACGGALVGGARLALAREFSVRRFWPEVRRYGATVVFYVGEMCRYLVTAPERPHEERHPVRLFVGNGMRAEVWEKMLERFGPVGILEFYGSTEGNVVLANLDADKLGSVGAPLPGTDAIALVRYDAATGEALRDADGRLMRSEPGQPGLLIAAVGRDHPLAHFDGYLDPQETERKTLRDVFAPGDAWFNTGDLLRRDDDGDYWFVDRLGDTFRWHGENVSTQQVAQTLDRAEFCEMASVYGVEVPGYEGRAGMAAMVLSDGSEFDGCALYELVAEHLFPAARPRFVRVVDELPTTDSFKFVTMELREQGADPNQIDDALYWYDAASKAYRRLTPQEWVPENI